MDEVQGQWALFAQDSWRVSHTLTLNYGLCWDFTGDDHDITNAYHSITVPNLLGPSTSLFTPGMLSGNLNPTIDTIPHASNGWNVAPELQVGFAWNPSGDTFGKILGHGDTVIRGGMSLKRFTMPEQYFWNNASSYGSFLFQNFNLNANNSATPDTFAPGSLALGDTLPPYILSPATYVQSEAQPAWKNTSTSPTLSRRTSALSASSASVPSKSVMTATAPFTSGYRSTRTRSMSLKTASFSSSRTRSRTSQPAAARPLKARCPRPSSMLPSPANL